LQPGQLRQVRLPGATGRRSSTKLFDKIQNAPRAADRAKLLGDAQRMLADEAVHGFLYQPQSITVANKGLKGLWKDMPVFVNDVSALSWS